MINSLLSRRNGFPAVRLWVAVTGLAVAPGLAQTNNVATNAPAAVKKISAPGLGAAANNNIAIPRGAMGKEFMLSASIIPQSGSPTSVALAGKVVRFELFHDGVDMYESTQGLVVTDELPARRLLTTFPIVEQDENRVVIDFNRGMRRVFTDIWYYGDGLTAAARERSLEVPQSRIFEVRQEGDLLVIRQSAQARDRERDSNREELYEVRYFVGPYQAGDIKGKESRRNEYRYVRYFETPPLIETNSGRISSVITRFDIRQPVLFYYSSNTPTNYVEAVKEGILYWNRAFGKEIIKVDKAPDGVTAPDARLNIIQWVPWDNAGFAYADLLADPRTGTALRGQAYITSAFAFVSKSSARILLRRMRAATDVPAGKDKGDKPPGPEKQLGIDFLPSATVCSVDQRVFAQELAAGIEGMLAEGKLDDAAVLRVSQDYVRDVVSHEVGHILGLEHNFAGSLAATLSHKELDDWFRQYVVDANTNTFADRITTSSVMEYDVFKSRVFIGHEIHTSTNALPYDRAAIQWGYFDSQEPVEKKLLYGFGGHEDVRTFDYGPDPVVSAYASLADQIQGLPNTIIETFIRAKAPRDPRDRVPLKEVNFSVEGSASAIVANLSRALVWFNAATRSLKVENAFDFIGDLNHDEVVQAHYKALNEQIEKLGGVDRLAFSFLPVDLKLDFKGEPKETALVEKIDSKKLGDRLAKLLDAPAYTNFTGLDEKTYTFTKDEKELIARRAKKLFADLEKAVVKHACLALERAKRDISTEANKSIGEDDAVAQLEKRIIDFAKLVITAKDDGDHRKGKVDKSLVEVVGFKYDLETRLAAARMLNDNIGSFKGWSVDAKSDLNKQLKDEVDAALNIQNFKDFQESMLSRPLREWYLDQQAVLALLPSRKH
jgi:hypothetical protein